jgi:hypothetical protein
MQKELKRLWSLEVESSDFQAELKKIRLEKRKMICRAFSDLVITEAALKGCENEGPKPQFSSYKEELRKLIFTGLEEVESPGENPIEPFESLIAYRAPQITEDNFYQIFALLMSLDYIPPDKPRELTTHLWVLWAYYYVTGYNTLSALLDMRLDLALCKLLLAEERLCAKEKRVKRIPQGIKSIKDPQKERLLKLFKWVEKTELGLRSKNAIANAIRRELLEELHREKSEQQESKEQKHACAFKDYRAPSIKTITRFLNELWDKDNV